MHATLVVRLACQSQFRDYFSYVRGEKDRPLILLEDTTSFVSLMSLIYVSAVSRPSIQPPTGFRTATVSPVEDKIQEEVVRCENATITYSCGSESRAVGSSVSDSHELKCSCNPVWAFAVRLLRICSGLAS